MTGYGGSVLPELRGYPVDRDAVRRGRETRHARRARRTSGHRAPSGWLPRLSRHR
jgi:hypothetical protein